MMILNHDNYFSPKAEDYYLSYSQFKAFERCEEAALMGIRKERLCFTEGHFFEAILNDEETTFMEEHPEMLTNNGHLRSNYQKIVECAAAVQRHPMLKDIIGRCQKQRILIGVIAGVPFKGCIDLYDPNTADSYDTKAVKDFKKVWSPENGARLDWYFAYGYHYQAAIYRELIWQNFRTVGDQHLIAATKESVPDVGFYRFNGEILDNAMEIIEAYAPRYAAIKRGEIKAERCGHCDWCKSTKEITRPVIIEEFK